MLPKNLSNRICILRKFQTLISILQDGKLVPIVLKRHISILVKYHVNRAKTQIPLTLIDFSFQPQKISTRLLKVNVLG